MKILKEDNKLKLQVSDEEVYDLHYSFRINMIYEAVTDKNLDIRSLVKITDWFLILHAVIIATLQYNKSSCKIGYEELMDVVDDCGGDEIMIEFMAWFIKQLGIQDELMPKIQEEEKKTRSRKKTRR